MLSQGYWIDSQLCVLVLWLFYVAVLHRRIPSGGARSYLLAMLPLGMLLPLVRIPILPAPEPMILSEWIDPALLMTEETVPMVLAPEETIDWLRIVLWSLYGVGAAAVGMVQAVRILRLRFGTLRGTRRGDLLFSENVAGAYSAFGRIVVNDKFRGSPMLEAILTHERSHISYRHGADLLWSALWRTLLWFNPTAWHGGKLLREVHEFQADRAVLRQGVAVGPYMELLIGTEAGIFPAGATSTLCYLQTKKRLEMMTQNHSFGSRTARFVRLATLPLVGGTLLCAFSLTARAAVEPTDSPKTYTVERPDSASNSPQKTDRELPDRLENNAQPHLDIDGLRSEAKNDTVSVRTHKTSQGPLVVIDGKVTDQEQQARLSPHDLQRIIVLKDQAAIDRFGEAGRNGAIVITTQKKADSEQNREKVYYGTYTPDGPTNQEELHQASASEQNRERVYYGTYTPDGPTNQEEMRKMALRLQVQSDSLREAARAFAAAAQMRTQDLEAEAAALRQRAEKQKLGPWLTISGKGSVLYYRNWENKSSKPVETTSNKRQVTTYLTREEQEQGITPGAKLLKDCPKMFYQDGNRVCNVDPIRVIVYTENLQ